MDFNQKIHIFKSTPKMNHPSSLLLALVCALSMAAKFTRTTASRHSELADLLDSEGEREPALLDAMGPIAAQTSGVQCEPITIGLCAQMAYRSTRMPNFFRDSSQIEASDRAPQYRDLVSSKCSPHIHAYICELLTPVCLEDSREAMKRFEIYPCRSFCRKVKRDCEDELLRLNERLFSQGSSLLLPGFACDQLPFESNGGNGTLRGPCHETPEVSNQQQQQQQATRTNYRPYQPALDSNIPPFITDTSRLDASNLKPNLAAETDGFQQQTTLESQPNVKLSSNQSHELAPDKTKHQLKHQQQTSTVASQLNHLVQSFLLALSRYSNVLSIATVICLLIVLNAKRLRRLKTYLRFSPSSSTCSGHQIHGGYLQPSAKHHSVSPSSSSRSLMLIASSNKQAPSHHLIPASIDTTEPSQKLLHGLNQKTLINVNGTLERQQQHNRYLIMQSGSKQRVQAPFPQHSDKQQLFGTLDSQSSSNQYDYIQVGGDQASFSERAGQHNFRARQQQQQQQQQQLYSNILLSSPSHQVLLLNNPQQQQQQEASNHRLAEQSPRHLVQQLSQSRQHHQPQPSRNAPYFTTALSPYAAPNNQPAEGQQRSFQRRHRHNSAGSQHRLLAGGPRRTVVSSQAGSPASSSSAASTSSSSGAKLSRVP